MGFFRKGKHEQKVNGNYTVSYRHLATGKHLSRAFNTESAMKKFMRRMRNRKEIVIDHFATVF